MYCGHCGAENPDGYAFCSRCGKRLAGAHPGASTPAGPSPSPVDPSTPDPLSAALTEFGLGRGVLLSGRYRIEGELGMGGMGRVYLARDQVLEIPVALKVLRDVLRQDPTALKHLKREAKLSMGLSHPNVVRVHTFEEGPEEKFLVMEYVEGETLASRLAREEILRQEEAKRIGVEVCQALEHAHGQGVVHRDLKPGNILLTKTGGVKVADFGIARVAKDSTTRLTGLQTAGTLLYMAPEQVMGKAEARSDLYSLGVVLYEVLSGEVPFCTGDVTHQILHRAPEPLNGASPDLNALILKLLAKEPAARLASAAEVTAELDGRAEEVRRKAAEERARGEQEEARAGPQDQPASGDEELDRSNDAAARDEPPAPRARAGPRRVDRDPNGAKASPSAGEVRVAAKWTPPPLSPGIELGVDLRDNQFVRVEPGLFRMGSIDGEPNERPVREVRITKPFELLRTPVTQRQWKTVMGTNPSQFLQAGDLCPAEQVSWDAVQAFLRELHLRFPGKRYRLPTEAEWEYACRGGSTAEYSGSGSLHEMSWYDGNSQGRTRPVGRKYPNAWGLYDMHGNVGEWVHDWYGHDYFRRGPKTNPTGPKSGTDKVLRGGSWFSSAKNCRTATRMCESPSLASPHHGFRLVRTP